MKSQWLAALAETLKQEIEIVPKGWVTANDAAVIFDKSESHTKRLLYAMVRAGKVDVKSFRIRTASQVRKIPHYRLKA